MKFSILVVEDDLALAKVLHRALSPLGYEVGVAHDWAEARGKLDTLAPDVVLLDMNLPDANGLDVLAELATDRPVIMLTAYGSIHHAVQAMRLGAIDYLTKPVNLEELELVIRRAIDSGRMRAARVVEQAASSVRRVPSVLGASPAMQQLHGLIAAVAETDVTVLVTGESGVGKELVAHALHQASLRRHGSFVAVDCCTLQETLFESELFGHERGSFTGADRRKPGLIEAAAGGTLFLDEIGDIGPALQAKLLRVLETGRFRRVGATSDLRADVRVLAATNRNLQAMVQEGRFRADLYYRLTAFEIEVPPLRERREDIPELVQNFAEKSARGGSDVRFLPQTVRMLCEHTWPGNVRELRNVVERAVLLSGPSAAPGRSEGAGAPPWGAASASERGGSERVVAPHHLPPLHVGTPPPPDPGTSITALLDGEPTLDELELRYLRILLERYSGNRRRVAQAMGISERTAYRMLDRHGLSTHGLREVHGSEPDSRY